MITLIILLLLIIRIGSTSQPHAALAELVDVHLVLGRRLTASGRRHNSYIHINTNTNDHIINKWCNEGIFPERTPGLSPVWISTPERTPGATTTTTIDRFQTGSGRTGPSQKCCDSIPHDESSRTKTYATRSKLWQHVATCGNMWQHSYGKMRQRVRQLNQHMTNCGGVCGPSVKPLLSSPRPEASEQWQLQHTHIELRMDVYMKNKTQLRMSASQETQTQRSAKHKYRGQCVSHMCFNLCGKPRLSRTRPEAGEAGGAGAGASSDAGTCFPARLMLCRLMAFVHQQYEVSAHLFAPDSFFVASWLRPSAV